MFSLKKDKKEEGQMFLLCAEMDMEKIMTAICKSFGLSRGNNSSNITLSAEGISIQINAITEEMGEDAKKFVGEQKNGIWGHFWHVPAEKQKDTDRKINVLHQIKMTHGFCSINYSFEGNHLKEKKQELTDKLTKTLTELRGLLLVVGDGEDCLLEGNGRILLSDKGKSQVDSFMPYMDRELINMPKEGISEEQMQRRAKSRQYFESRGIYVMEGYPYIESLAEAKIRSKEEMVDRATALLAVSLYSECMLGHGMSSAEARDYAKEHALDRFKGDEVFSPKEKAYFYNDNATEQEKISYSWQYENLYVMDWALGLVEALPFPDAICDVPLTVRVLEAFPNREALLSAVKPRSGSELLDACDLIFCLDWACVDARVYRLPAPAGMNGGITMERHKTLNWLVGSGAAEWDDVDVST